MKKRLYKYLNYAKEQITETRLLWCAIAIATTLSFTFTSSFDQLHSDYIVSRAGSQVVKLVAHDTVLSGGTGFVVKAPSGRRYTLTNGHVCALGRYGFVRAIVPGSSDTYSLAILAVSQETDLCLLDPVPGFDGIRIASSASIGENVSVVGHPLLDPLTFVRGRLTAEQTIDVLYGINVKEEQCQGDGYTFKDLSGTPAELFGIKTACLRTIKSVLTTLGIYPGNSGSPAVNKYGNLIGVVFAGNNTTNYGYVIPLEQVVKFLGDF